MKGELTEVEKKFAEGLVEALTPGGEPWTLEPEHREYIRESMKKTAYHEAGHFLVRAFTQHGLSHVLCISIIPNKDGQGHFITESPCSFLSFKQYPPEIRRVFWISALLSLLAGHRAEMILNGREGETVFDYMEDDDPCLDDGLNDLDLARHIAGILSRPYMPAHRWLTLADRWTAEILKIPSVWEGVKKVAGLLLSRGEITDREEICRLSTSLNIPCIYDSPKWERRLRGRFPTIPPEQEGL